LRVAALNFEAHASPLQHTSEISNVFRRPQWLASVNIYLKEDAMELMKGLKAIASPTRLRVLELLKNPGAFPGPRTADGRAIGVTAKALLKPLGCKQPSLNEQMQILMNAGLVEARKVGRWVIYTRDEERIRQLKQTIIDQLLPPAS